MSYLRPIQPVYDASIRDRIRRGIHVHSLGELRRLHDTEVGVDWLGMLAP